MNIVILAAKIEQVEELVKPILLRLAAHYLLIERRRSKALDPVRLSPSCMFADSSLPIVQNSGLSTLRQVANFHLRNGASLWRLNWRADPSARGWDESFGIRVNYRYDVNHLMENNRQYVVDSCIAVAPAILDMLRSDPTRYPRQYIVQG